MKSTWIKVAGITAVAALLALFARFLLGGNEDTWICINGSWVKHGNPISTPPTTQCGYTP